MCTFRIRSDYKVEYNKLRAQKLAEGQKSAAERLQDIAETTTIGAEVPMASFVTEISSGRELSEMYLKHAADESSDEEEDDGVPVMNGDAEKEEDEFNHFVRQQIEKQQQKIRMSSVVDKSSAKQSQ